MLGMPRTRLLVVPLLACACHTSSTVPISPKTSGPLPAHSTVVLNGGRRVPVEDAFTARDSVFGLRLNGTRLAVPYDSVAYVESRQVSVLRSVGAGVGGLAVGLVVLGVATILVALGSLQ